MKTIIMTAAVVACAAVVSAQTVTSVNIVGYNKYIALEAGLYIAGMQFNNDTNTPETVYGASLPVGSEIFAWNGDGYDSALYGEVFVPGQGMVTQWDAAPTLGNGDGYWIDVAAATEAVLSGEVPAEGSITNILSAGVNLISYPYPVERTVIGMEFDPVEGDEIFMWTGAGYETALYGEIFVPQQGFVVKWDNETLSVDVGQGFWYDSVATQTWVVNKPF